MLLNLKRGHRQVGVQLFKAVKVDILVFLLSLNSKIKINHNSEILRFLINLMAHSFENLFQTKILIVTRKKISSPNRDLSYMKLETNKIFVKIHGMFFFMKTYNEIERVSS